MCSHCRSDFSKRVWDPADPMARLVHDAYMFPHGRPGYSGATVEDVMAAKLRCPFCSAPVAGVQVVTSLG